MPKKKKTELKTKKVTVAKLLDQLASLKEEAKVQKSKRNQLHQEVYRLQMERDIIEASCAVFKKEKFKDFPAA